MRKLILAISTVALAVSAAYADPIADRRAIMKERGGLIGGLVKMVKGETEFDAAAVQKTLDGLKANEAKVDIDALFPAGSDKGDTKADPKIWSDMDGFKAVNKKYSDAVDAAAAAPAADKEALGAQLQTLGGLCGECHKTYRLPQQG
jgi:cytochrome c556